MHSKHGMSEEIGSIVHNLLHGCSKLQPHLLETFTDEVLEELAEVSLQGRRGVVGDQEQDSHWVQVSVRRLSCRHLQAGYVFSSSSSQKQQIFVFLLFLDEILLEHLPGALSYLFWY